VPVFAGIFLANVIKAYLAGDLAKTMANTFSAWLGNDGIPFF
jgi:hypothetical protein